MRSRPSAVFYILILLAVAVTVGLIFLVGPSANIDTVPVILPEAAPENSSTETDPADSAPQVLELTAENVQSALRTLSRDESYSRSLCAESYWSGGSTRRNIDLWVDGDRVRMDISRSDGGDTIHLLFDGGEKWLWYEGRYGLFTGAAAENEADRWQSLLSYEHILDLPAGDIIEADYSEYGGGMCIRVRYSYGRLGYENVCYVSIESGLVMGEESWDGDSLVYSLSSTEPDLSQPEPDIFALP